MHPSDNVVTVLSNVGVGERVSFFIREELRCVEVRQVITFGHKIAIRRIEKDNNIIKYGEVIGKAKKQIEQGEHVHVHNVESTRAR